MRFGSVSVGFGAVAALSALAISSVFAQEKAAELPVREVTVFKDGHAFVIAEGSLPVKDGSVTIDSLPNPVLGTFWPYATGGAKVTQTVASRKPVSGTRPIESPIEFLKANIGKNGMIRETDGESYRAQIVSVTDAMALLKTGDSLKSILVSRIRDVSFPADAKTTLETSVATPRLTLSLSGVKNGNATVGVAYVQKGLRWIPSYRVELDGKGQAKISLQATLVNELVDLDDSIVNLVIGVPSFAFAENADPIGLVDAITSLGTIFSSTSRTGGAALSNAIMGQGAGRFGERAPYGQGGGDASGDGLPLADSAGNEDLFVFTLKNLTLKKGARMVVPVATYTVPYKNVYTLELLPSPVRNAGGFYDASTLSANRPVGAPRATHQIRLTNSSAYPFTTAPALILRDGKVLAQGMTNYIPRGGNGDLPLTGATEITVKRTDTETKRTPDSLRMDNTVYEKVDLAGSIELCNFKAEPVEIEVVRYVLGKVTDAGLNGKFVALDPLADDAIPGWIAGYGLDRIRFTGLGKITWTATLPGGGKTCVNLPYAWHYFTR